MENGTVKSLTVGASAGKMLVRIVGISALTVLSLARALLGHDLVAFVGGLLRF